ncbi:DUF1643 domain-containing protein [Arenimonas metalli]|uniref:DUF1643 domain-containing protein n=1 Tax=Arenimonas metalli TaxID=948077 RepID=UPI0009FC4A4D|nr:DUF1643 domain-containing protein [Arenimonas metalli]
MSITKIISSVITDDAVHDAGGRSRLPWPEDSVVEPVFSSCQKYRYRLSEVWDTNKSLVMWVLMNPSVACVDYRDPTLRKTGKFSRAWGYGGQLVANVHAYRATDKGRLLEVADPVGPDNDEMIRQMAQQAERIVLAFGKPPRRLRGRGQDVIKLLEDHSDLCYLRMAKDGVTPFHPLYLPDDTVPVRYVRIG